MKFPKLYTSILSSALMALPLLGQVIPQPSSEVVELSKFEVSAKANRGYVTTSSMSASRVSVPITELPAGMSQASLKERDR